MTLNYRYRLYPSKVQEGILQDNLDACRWLYNHLLAQMNEPRNIARAYGWTDFKGVPSQYDLQAQLPKLKQSHPFLADVNSKALQMVLHQLYSNLRALSKSKRRGRKVGSLRFKGKAWYKTLTFNQSGFKVIDRKLSLSKVGDINVKLHRPIEGEIKQVKIKREQTGKWFAILSVDIAQRDISRSDRQVGIDLGLTHYSVDSDKLYIKHPENIKKAEKQLAKEQRRLSRKKPGSKNRAKQRIKIATIHDKVINRRRDFLHKLSRYYTDTYGFIAVEDLNCKEMMESTYNARKHADSSWSTFIRMVEYKAENAGIQFVKVDPKGTTQDCSQCGETVRKRLWDRVHICPRCGFEADRDYNASLNILKRGLSSIGEGLAESTPVDIVPLLERHVPASTVVEAGSPHHL